MRIVESMSTPALNLGMRPDGSLATRAYHVIKEKILNRELPGGSVVVEGRLATKLDLSRTPLREALRRLAGEGLLVKEGSRQFTVRQVSAAEFFQSMRVRELLETEAVVLAVGRLSPETTNDLRSQIRECATKSEQRKDHWLLDDRIHEHVAEASGNAVAARIIKDLRAATRMFEINRPFERVNADAQEHLAILDAIDAGDRDPARAAMRYHLQKIQAEVMDALSGA